MQGVFQLSMEQQVELENRLEIWKQRQPPITRRNVKWHDASPIIVNICCIHFAEVSEVMFPYKFLTGPLHSLVKMQIKFFNLLLKQHPNYFCKSFTRLIQNNLHTEMFKFAPQNKYLYFLLKQLNLCCIKRQQEMPE